MGLQAAPPTLVMADVAAPTAVTDGPFLGRRCALLRLGGCNLACSWCDVPQSWDGSRFDLANTLPRRLVSTVLDEALGCAPALVVVSGGEPLLQQRSRGWAALLEGLGAAGVEIHVETNGTTAPTRDTIAGVHRFVVSPKLAHTGEPAWTRMHDDVLTTWAALARADRADLVFVVRDRMDITTVTSLAMLHQVPSARVWVSPEGTSAERIARVVAEVAPAALASGFNVTPRLPSVQPPRDADGAVTQRRAGRR